MYRRGGGERIGAGTFGEHVVGTETRIEIGISKQKPSDLFACRWLRARAKRLDQIDLEGEHL